MVVFLKEAMDRLCAYAADEYPREGCGIMLGKRSTGSGIVCRVIQTGNMIEESKSTGHFLVDPLELLRIEQQAERDEMEIIGFYHSHPDCDVTASEEDLRYMIAGYSYLIVSVKSGICVQVKSYKKLKQTDYDAIEERIMIKEK